jgi:predicted nucleic acid-binding protein
MGAAATGKAEEEAMKGEVAKYVLLDTGFWIGLLDARDGRHAAASKLYVRIEPYHVLVPWPTLYEFMGTVLVKRHEQMQRLAHALRSPGVERICDRVYRDQALADCLHEGARRRPMSLVDRVLRYVAQDTQTRLHAIVTFNPGDFVDVCRERDLELLAG